MKRKSTRITAMLLCCIMLVGVLAGCENSSAKNAPSASMNPDDKTSQTQTASAEPTPEALEGLDMNVEATRANYVKHAEELKGMYQQNPDDHDIMLKYAQILYTLGDFDEAQEILSPLLKEKTPSPDATYLSAQLEYLNGNYVQAETQYKMLVKEHDDEYGLAAEAGLQMVYYQTNQYDKASQLFAGIEGMENPILAMMKAFSNTTPYQIDWNGSEQTTIRFVVTDPGPVIPIEINGVRMLLLIPANLCFRLMNQLHPNWGLNLFQMPKERLGVVLRILVSGKQIP